MAMKLVPDRKKFMDLLGGGNLNADMESFVSSFAPLLQENHKFLVSLRQKRGASALKKVSFKRTEQPFLLMQKSVGLDDMKAS